MGVISSQFIVTALEDGSTIHGTLSSDRTLTQIVGASVAPDWTKPENQPTITLRVMKGASYLTAQNYKWYINGVEIDASDSRFVIGTATISGIVCPTLKIVQNLGGLGNLDLDVISIAGKVESNGAMIEFSAGIEVKISRSTGAGYIPSLGFVNGKSWIDTAKEYICVYAMLATDEGNVSAYSCKWFRNYDTEVTATSAPAGGGSYKSTVTIGGVTYPCLYLYEGDVDDFTVLRCEYYVDNVLVAQETANIDDEQDPDRLYITYGANSAAYEGTPASLKSGSVTFNIWASRTDNAADTAVMRKYVSYKLKLLNSDGGTITANIDGIHDADGDGWRTLTRDSSTLKCSVAISYGLTVSYGGKITGIIKASTTA